MKYYECFGRDGYGNCRKRNVYLRHKRVAVPMINNISRQVVFLTAFMWHLSLRKGVCSGDRNKRHLIIRPGHTSNLQAKVLNVDSTELAYPKFHWEAHPLCCQFSFTSFTNCIHLRPIGRIPFDHFAVNASRHLALVSPQEAEILFPVCHAKAQKTNSNGAALVSGNLN